MKKKRIKPTKDIIFTIQHSCLLDSYSNWTIKQYINSETDFFRIEKVAFIPSSNEMILGCQLQWRPWRWCQSYWLGMRLSSSFSCLYALVGTWIQKAGRFATPFGIGREHLTMVLTETPRGVFGEGLAFVTASATAWSQRWWARRSRQIEMTCGRCIRVTKDYRFHSNMNDEVQSAA